MQGGEPNAQVTAWSVCRAEARAPSFPKALSVLYWRPYVISRVRQRLIQGCQPTLLFRYGRVADFDSGAGGTTCPRAPFQRCPYACGKWRGPDAVMMASSCR
jgi:hypothetical protein